jgi:hypothetical protein
MATMLPSRTLSVSIKCGPDKVYEFLSNPENWPKWAKGLGQSLKKVNGKWIVDTPQGQVKIRFTEINKFGILDHYVKTPTGTEIYVPMRVIANGTGSEVIFTLFRLPEMTEERYVEDQKLVEDDLRKLEHIMEK